MNTQNNSVTRLRCLAGLVCALLLMMASASSTAHPTVDLTEQYAHYARAPADGLTQLFSGNITGAVDDVLTIANAIGNDHRFRVSEETTIMLNDTEASFDALATGLHATVMAESRGSEWIALSIDARHEY